ncbi:hypothetical protein DLAC_03075 [Tieghemostelium lacteum]|uniref:Uncharacterized protein n=1 Tax=Tieghemostelium lacteum TaxID=361077 RepID=A0A152A255_TIELA|nr:hypothetical protein DLAC_03075 [Tieghemostelium lacteum]|eukprot:KYR00333.1 hypothetical protein DLAC_03075 [Tieghemostelium lacteum]
MTKKYISASDLFKLFGSKRDIPLNPQTFNGSTNSNTITSPPLNLTGGATFDGLVIPNTGVLSSNNTGEHYIEKQLIVFAHYIVADKYEVSYKDGVKSLVELGKSYDLPLELDVYLRKKLEENKKPIPPPEDFKKQLTYINNGKYQITRYFMKNVMRQGINERDNNTVLDLCKKYPESAEYMVKSIHFGLKVIDRLTLNDLDFGAKYSTSEKKPSEVKSQKQFETDYVWISEFFSCISRYIEFIQKIDQILLEAEEDDDEKPCYK